MKNQNKNNNNRDRCETLYNINLNENKTMDLQVLNTLIEALNTLQTELPPNIKDEKEIFAYKSGLNNALFLAYTLLENNGEFPPSPFKDFKKS